MKLKENKRRLECKQIDMIEEYKDQNSDRMQCCLKIFNIFSVAPPPGIISPTQRGLGQMKQKHCKGSEMSAQTSKECDSIKSPHALSTVPKSSFSSHSSPTSLILCKNIELF